MGDEKDSWKVKTLDEILQEKKRRKEQEEKAEIKRLKNSDDRDSKRDSLEEGELRDHRMEITIRNSPYRREDSMEDRGEEDDSLAIKPPQQMSRKEKAHHRKDEKRKEKRKHARVKEKEREHERRKRHREEQDKARREWERQKRREMAREHSRRERDRLEQLERKRERERKLREQQKEQREQKERERRAEERRKEREARREVSAHHRTMREEHGEKVKASHWSRSPLRPPRDRFELGDGRKPGEVAGLLQAHVQGSPCTDHCSLWSHKPSWNAGRGPAVLFQDEIVCSLERFRAVTGAVSIYVIFNLRVPCYLGLHEIPTRLLRCFLLSISLADPHSARRGVWRVPQRDAGSGHLGGHLLSLAEEVSEEEMSDDDERENENHVLVVPESRFDRDSGESEEGEEEGGEGTPQSSALTEGDCVPDSPALSPIELKQELPKYLPALQGCRSVEEFQCLNRIEEGTYGVVYRAKDKKTGIPTCPRALYPASVSVSQPVEQCLHRVAPDAAFSTLAAVSSGSPGQVVPLRLIPWPFQVGDFGLAREYGSPLKAYTPVVVTLWYRAPELLLGAKEYSTAIDMWSVGCIFGELLTQKPLFPGKSDIDQINKVFKDLGTPSEKIWPGYSDLPAVKKMTFTEYPYNNLRKRFGALLSDQGFDLMNKFLTYFPGRRINAEDGLKHEYFRETPLPIDPSMFPTWPAKSEQQRVKRGTSPRPPEGGLGYSQLGDDDLKETGFHLTTTNQGASAAAPGFSLKF
nr:cyclin-dependent kinase 11B [Loxodonta africana]